jgi:hypothetical protein
MCIRVCASMNICVYLCISVCICVYPCVFVYIWRSTRSHGYGCAHLVQYLLARRGSDVADVQGATVGHLEYRGHVLVELARARLQPGAGREMRTETEREREGEGRERGRDGALQGVCVCERERESSSKGPRRHSPQPRRATDPQLTLHRGGKGQATHTYARIFTPSA